MKYSTLLSLVSLLLVQSGFAQANVPLDVSVDDRAIVALDGGPIVSYADVLDEATSSVVAVYTAQIVRARDYSLIPEIYRYYGRPVPIPESELPIRERKEQLGVGSGVIISEDGYIITNNHVVEGMRGQAADEIRVRLNNQTEFVATLIGSDPKTDVAVLKIESEHPLPAVVLADSDRLRVGDVVFAIGNPLDVGLTATQGIVSATGRNQGGRILGPGSYENFIQTDAAINLGNSGGALIDAWGRLIGINTAIVSGSGGSIGIGFAIPINMALNVATNIIERGEVPRGMLGLFPDDLTPELAGAFGLENTRGALVNQVQENSPASRADIRHGDIITLVDDTVIDSAAQLRLVVSQILPGTEVDITLIRSGQTILIPVTLGSLSGNMPGIDVPASPLKGVKMRVLSDELRASFSIPDEIDGVLITDVSEGSPYVDTLERLMVVLEVNGNPITQVDDVAEHLVNGQNRFYIWAGGKKRFVVFQL